MNPKIPPGISKTHPWSFLRLSHPFLLYAFIFRVFGNNIFPNTFDMYPRPYTRISWGEHVEFFKLVKLAPSVAGLSRRKSTKKIVSLTALFPERLIKNMSIHYRSRSSWSSNCRIFSSCQLSLWEGKCFFTCGVFGCLCIRSFISLLIRMDYKLFDILFRLVVPLSQLRNFWWGKGWNWTLAKLI